MNFVVSKLNRDFTLHLVACDEDEQKFLEAHIGEIIELHAAQQPLAVDASTTEAIIEDICKYVVGANTIEEGLEFRRFLRERLRR